MFSLYLQGNTSSLRYNGQAAIAVKGNRRCLFWELYETHKHFYAKACAIYSGRWALKS
jgi:hypothetical protein